MQEHFDESSSVRESQEIVQAVREGEAEIEAGGGKPVDEAFADIRSKLGWTEWVTKLSSFAERWVSGVAAYCPQMIKDVRRCCGPPFYLRKSA